ncbi:DUF262 domain-containing protein [Stenotrophomonas hibiscicola]|uniref:DUF262 domain-containing protein n=1 Tax=Stenotrophomonas hibiscicola TaxID=86189 RepID=UPI0032094047
MTANSTHLPNPAIDSNRRDDAETQIKSRQKDTDFDIREYPIEVIVGKFITKLENDKAELFIPDYQRELIWKPKQQSRFIESILLDLPVPYLYVADVTSGEDEGRIEVVDGSQRIRTLVRFMENAFELQGLEVLDKLNGFRFHDFTLSRQLRFRRKTMRMIELIEVDEEARRQLFDRLNSGGTNLTDMEKRLGSRDGPFMSFIRELAGSPKLISLCPISQVRQDHREYEEMVLRFFAYREKYQSFSKSVIDFLNSYLDEKNDNFDRAFYENQFNEMLDFVDNFLPHGFRKNASNNSVPRIRFEAISVGVSLAIGLGCTAPASLEWLDSEEFRILTRSDASNSRPKVIARIEFVQFSLLGQPLDISSAMGADSDSD